MEEKKPNLKKDSFDSAEIHYEDYSDDEDENSKLVNPLRKGVNYHTNGNIKFSGFFKKGLREGYGIEYYENGCKKYEAIYSNNLKDGTGTEYNSKGLMRYQGNFKKNKKNGFGIQYHLLVDYESDQIVEFQSIQKFYEGNWKDDQIDGFGCMWHVSGEKSTEGIFKNGQLDGFGKLYYSDGSVQYEGNFNNGLKNGKGVAYHAIQFPDEDDIQNPKIQFEGFYKDGFLEGYCIEYGISGNKKFDGYFKQDLKQGKGTYYYYDGIVKYTGNYFKNQKNGKGTLYYPNGQPWYEGQWKSDKKQGKGTKFDISGKKLFDGDWALDDLVNIDIGIDEEIIRRNIVCIPNMNTIYIGPINQEFQPNGLGGMLVKRKGGMRIFKGEWMDGYKHGSGRDFWSNLLGNLKFIGDYVRGVQVAGVTYYENGKMNKITYTNFCEDGLKLKGSLCIYGDDGSIIGLMY